MSEFANYVRVRIDTVGATAATARPVADAAADLPHAQLLCTVRSLLRKMRRTVVVGDRVRVTGIDWVSGRGQVDEVHERRSELLHPAVANVDHVLLAFSLHTPPVGARRRPEGDTTYHAQQSRAACARSTSHRSCSPCLPDELQPVFISSGFSCC